jgi:hypothetical protein
LTIYDELDKMLLAKQDISKLREPIVFWANDDTVEPGNSYRYRVRLGVFNPVAGTGQVSAEDQAYAGRVILWGEYSDVTQTVEIPHRLYFFPMSVQEPARAVDVQVCRYAMGYWRSEDFVVKRGEVIGKIAEAKTEPAEGGKEAKLPETIDYSTGAMFVDYVPVNDWSGGKALQQRRYFDMLYSFDGAEIERTAAKQACWPEELKAKYAEIKTLEKRQKEPLREWSSGSVIGARRVGLPGAPTKSPKEKEDGMTSQGEMMMKIQQ